MTRLKYLKELAKLESTTPSWSTTGPAGAAPNGSRSPKPLLSTPPQRRRERGSRSFDTPPRNFGFSPTQPARAGLAAPGGAVRGAGERGLPGHRAAARRGGPAVAGQLPG